MSNTLVEPKHHEQEPFEPVLWIDYKNEDVGTASRHHLTDGNGVDIDLKQPEWPTPTGLERISQSEGESGISHAVSSYGYSVYKEFQQIDPEMDTYLDDRVFMDGTRLIDVLVEATACAIDDKRDDLSVRLLAKAFEYAEATNFGRDDMQDHVDFALGSKDSGVISMYVNFMNENLSRHLDKDFMKEMAHKVLNLDERNQEHQDGIDRFKKHELLKEIGMAWIRKGMPVAEIDWLP